MARFDGSNIDHYGSQGNGNGLSFFSLKNDKDVARVRFLYNGAEDIEGYSIHRVQVGERERDVNCLRDYNDPIDKCPFCKAKLPVNAKLYVPIFNEDTGEIQVWGRGKTFYAQISGLCARYPNTVGRTFDIERNGKAGDTKTTYNFYPVEQDDTTIEDILDDVGLDKLPDPLGTIILDKTADEMESFLQTGSFDSEGSVPSRRGRAKTEDTPPFEGGKERSSEMPRRRSRGGDRF